ncbi:MULTISPECIES: hypothetical protein [Acetobacter]|jgi:hypothetical protein|uniref:Uncharacterized protein n=2 Tax=Acetobacter TaxID=434 RepID=A0A841QHD8_9PROT|nr:hypothetical protein [Acetobacter lovaniensis]MBB6457664.1 hypothetical protein [Acetobacter lovaniensis]MCP1239979.1 hypothetical protein [Acetobacter lovaniensis]
MVSARGSFGAEQVFLQPGYRRKGLRRARGSAKEEADTLQNMCVWRATLFQVESGPVMLSVFHAAKGGRAVGAALSVCLLAGMVGCKPLDQRTFDPSASVEPKPYIPPPPPGPPPVPPLIELVAGTPQVEWKAPVDQIAHRALARKKEVLFVVSCLVPPQAGQEAEQTALQNLVQHDGHAIMQELVDAGVPEAQVEMSAMPDSSVTKPTIRVYVR